MAGMWKRRGRRRPSSPDPVAAAVAGIAVPLQPRQPETDVSWADLPGWVEVCEVDDVDGCNTMVGLSDEIHLFCDPYEDGLDQALADQRGISKVVTEDRDLIYLRSRLALEDVSAAVVRAVAEVHHRPRSPRTTNQEVPDAVVEKLAVEVAPLLQQAGFAAKVRSAKYFWRAGGDGFAQSVMLTAGSGYGGDGTSYSGLVSVSGGTYVPELAYWKIASPEQVVPGYTCIGVQGWAPPDLGRIREILTSQVIPAMDATRDRNALAAWVAEDPARARIPSAFALVFAQWGLLHEATRVVEHIETHWPSLQRAPDLLEAKTLILRGTAE